MSINTYPNINIIFYILFMKKKSFLCSSFFSDIKFSFLFAGGIFLLFFIGISSFAALNKDTLGPNGELTGGAFSYWMQEILLPNSLPVQNDLFAVGSVLENPTVKKTRQLVDENDSLVAIGKDGKLGIGTSTPSALVEVKGDTPRIVVSSLVENPQFTLLAENAETGTVFFDNAQKKLVFKTGENSVLSFDENGVANVRGLIKENNIVVVKADQKCENGFFVSGFNDQGGILCGVNN